MHTTTQDPKSEKKSIVWLIGGVSVLIPLAVAFLLFVPLSEFFGNLNTRFLPHLNAMLNSATSLCLMVGFWAIKSKKTNLHRNLMMTAFVLSSLFLVSYVVYHATTPHTVFGGTGWMKGVYYFILISHIVLAVVVVPLVLFSLYYALSKQFIKHKRLNRFTFPIWLYVAVTGVLVYLMISPYYV
jgi:putative membrane protein